jgi:DNA-binding XRE family transcriptional regulator
MKANIVLKKRIAKNLGTLRHVMGLSKEAIALELDISKDCYIQYERGRKNVPIYVLASVSSFFKVALETLVKTDLRNVDLRCLGKMQKNALLLAINDTNNYSIQKVVSLSNQQSYETVST